MSELEVHIAQFPSTFDKTDIARQLREASVPVQLYADVRDKLWMKLHQFRSMQDRVEALIYEAQEQLDEAMEYLGGVNV